MKSKHLIRNLYFRMKHRKKTYEQLQIGKIKFEVTPIYINNICVHSLFKLKYTQASNITPQTQTKHYSLLRVLILVLSLFFLYVVINNLLSSLGILTETNEIFINTITPYIFPDIPTHYTPYVTTLLKQANILNP